MRAGTPCQYGIVYRYSTPRLLWPPHRVLAAIDQFQSMGFIKKRDKTLNRVGVSTTSTTNTFETTTVPSSTASDKSLKLDGKYVPIVTSINLTTVKNINTTPPSYSILKENSFGISNSDTTLLPPNATQVMSEFQQTGLNSANTKDKDLISAIDLIKNNLKLLEERLYGSSNSNTQRITSAIGDTLRQKITKKTSLKNEGDKPNITFLKGDRFRAFSQTPIEKKLTTARDAVIPTGNEELYKLYAIDRSTYL